MKDGVMINAQAYHDTSLSNLLLTEKCSTGLSVNYISTRGRRPKAGVHIFQLLQLGWGLERLSAHPYLM